jgi:hypothetical protein
MFVRTTAEGRLLGFNSVDWLVLLCGVVLAGLVALFL